MRYYIALSGLWNSGKTSQANIIKKKFNFNLNSNKLLTFKFIPENKNLINFILLNKTDKQTELDNYYYQYYLSLLNSEYDIVMSDQSLFINYAYNQNPINLDHYKELISNKILINIILEADLNRIIQLSNLREKHLVDKIEDIYNKMQNIYHQMSLLFKNRYYVIKINTNNKSINLVYEELALKLHDILKEVLNFNL